jgi:hypothetical protein
VLVVSEAAAPAARKVIDFYKVRIKSKYVQICIFITTKFNVKYLTNTPVYLPPFSGFPFLSLLITHPPAIPIPLPSSISFTR